jgi:RnfABCDGE-type electron transport complex G subunit
MRENLGRESRGLAKPKGDMVIMVFVMTFVCLVSALALGMVNNLTEARIAHQKQLNEIRAVEKTLLRGEVEYYHDPDKDVIKIPEWKDLGPPSAGKKKDGNPEKIYLGRDKDGNLAGVAFTSVGEGYGGFIKIMLGIDLTGKLIGIEILEHLETPGLGANIESPELFKNQFRGKSAKGSPEGKLVVIKGRKAKENWEIEALTGATISPRGVVQAVNDGLANFKRYKKQILAAGGAK